MLSKLKPGPGLWGMLPPPWGGSNHQLLSKQLNVLTYYATETMHLVSWWLNLLLLKVYSGFMSQGCSSVAWLEQISLHCCKGRQPGPLEPKFSHVWLYMTLIGIKFNWKFSMNWVGKANMFPCRKQNVKNSKQAHWPESRGGERLASVLLLENGFSTTWISSPVLEFSCW